MRNRPETLRHMNGSLSQSLRYEGQRGEGTGVLVSLYSSAGLQWA
jgi:hypothetical protein